MAPRAGGGAPGIGRLWQGIWDGVSRHSILLSTAPSAVSFVIGTFFLRHALFPAVSFLLV